MEHKKNTAKRITALLLICVLALLVCACSDAEEKPVNPICAAWETEDFSAFEALAAEHGGSMEGFNGKLTLTFTADDTPGNGETQVKGRYRCAAAYEENGETQERAVSGAFYAEGGVLALDEITCTYAVKGDTLEISNENVTFTLNKAGKK